MSHPKQKWTRPFTLSLFVHLLLFQICYSDTTLLPNFDLSSKLLDPTKTGITITGIDIGDFFGYAARTAGDINNDGYDDIVVGAWARSGAKGEVYVIYGGPTSSLKNIDLSLISLDNASTGFKITGSAGSDQLGFSVSGAGDINNDGYDDIIIGAPGKSTAYVIYGNQRSLLQDIDLGLTPLNPGTTGFTITGSGKLGCSVGSAGNIDKDQFDDIIIGAADDSKAYVIYGRSSFGDINIASPLIPTSTGFVIKGKFSTDKLGTSVSSAGDLNNDGFGDIIISAPGWSGSRGEAYVIYGAEKSLMSDFDLSSGTTLNPGTTGFTLSGKVNNGYFGTQVSGVGSVNGDQYHDIMIGAYIENNERGVAYIIYGGEKSLMSDLDFSIGTTLDPATTGFTVTGDTDFDHLGWSLTFVGDLNGDKYDDIILGADMHDRRRGRSYVIYGRQASLLGNIDLRLSNLDPETTGFTISGNALNDQIGYANGGGDFNGDGYNDIIVSAPSRNSLQGALYIIHAACLVEHCSSCKSRVCVACDFGYSLSSDSRCFPSSPSSLGSETSSLNTASSLVAGAGSVVSIGSSIFPMMNLVSKIVQNTRYMDLMVTAELSEIYKTWNTDLIPWEVPDVVSRFDHYDPPNHLFAQYDIGSSFLSNFWSNMMTMSISLGIFLACSLFRTFLKGRREDWLSLIIEKMAAGSLNFTLVQICGCVDDVFFYLVLDLKTNPFQGFFSWASFLIAIAFTGLAIWLLIFNVLLVKRYQRAKTDKMDLEIFRQKNKHWELFYSDFDDADAWSHSFFAFLVIRSTLSSIIITTLYSSPVIQGTLLMILDGAIIGFMVTKRPFTTLRGVFFQYYFELITIIVHICTIILGAQEEDISEALKKSLSTCIIYMNTALVTGGIAFMFIEIHETIQEKINEWKLKKAQKKSNEIAGAELKENSKSLSNSQMPNIKQHRRDNRPQERITRRDQFTENNNNYSFSGFNLQPSHQALNSSMMAENSTLNENDDWMSQQRDQRILPVHVRRQVRAIRIEPR